MKRPKCVICGKPALVSMLNSFYCGKCVADFERIKNESLQKNIREVINGNNNLS